MALCALLTLTSVSVAAPAAGPAADPAGLPSVAVFPLVAQGMDNSSASILTDALSDELLKSRKVRVMERSQMETILREQGFQQTGSCDQNECAIQMGKLLGIDRIVVGSAGKIGNSFTLSLRAVDVTTGEILASERTVTQGSIDNLLTENLPPLARGIADRLSRHKAPAENAPVSEPVAEPAHHHSVWPWIVGGGVVAGGAAAAVLLLNSKSSNPAPSNSTSSFTASW
jgi:TolB-like protein